MATDIEAIGRNLASLYDFQGKSVVHVGAGGGQFVAYAATTRSVLAVDSDQAAADRLEQAIRERGLEDRFEIVVADFLSVSAEADVVFFEFCLHEIPDPAAALTHARDLAPEILILDHHPDSPWSWYTGETEKARRSWSAVRELPVVREASFSACHRFPAYPDLVARLEVLGESAISRIAGFVGAHDIEIEMTYTIALLRSGRT